MFQTSNVFPLDVRFLSDNYTINVVLSFDLILALGFLFWIRLPLDIRLLGLNVLVGREVFLVHFGMIFQMGNHISVLLL